MRGGDSAAVYSSLREAGCCFFAVERTGGGWDFIIGGGVLRINMQKGEWVSLPEKLGFLKYCGTEEKRRRLKLKIALPPDGDEKIISARHPLSPREREILMQNRG